MKNNLLITFNLELILPITYKNEEEIIELINDIKKKPAFFIFRKWNQFKLKSIFELEEPNLD